MYFSSGSTSIDEQVLKNTSLLDNEKYAEKMMIKIVFDELHKKHNLGLNAERTKQINKSNTNRKQHKTERTNSPK